MYAVSSLYNNKIYVIYKAQTRQISDSDTYDFILNILDLRTGVELVKKLYGSPHFDDDPIDMIVNQYGVYVMGHIGDGFRLKHGTVEYLTQNRKPNFAIIFMDYEGNIVEVESYDEKDGSDKIFNEYPKKMIIVTSDKHEPIYSFIGYRTFNEARINSGIYITELADHQALFVSGHSADA